jgi:hypothetical protein
MQRDANVVTAGHPCFKALLSKTNHSLSRCPWVLHFVKRWKREKEKADVILEYPKKLKN